MGIFNYFKKKHNQEDDNSKNDIVPNQTSQHTTNNYNGLSVEGELLRKVYPENITNGIFVVPSYIKSINAYAFAYLKDLHTVIMHDQIRYISPLAFQHCENLTTVKGLDNANTMKQINGFYDCPSLKNISLPSTIQLIGDGAFAGCKSLTSIDLSDDCWTIGKHAFARCENLKSIRIPSSTELIGTAAFADCKNLTVIFLEDNKKHLQDFIQEQKEYENQYRQDDFDEFETEEEPEDRPQITDEERQTLFDDLGIKYRKVNIGGKEILWSTGKIIIQEDALAGVKEVIAYNPDTIQRVTKSGYKGRITLIDKGKNEAVTIDIPAIENYKKELISAAREKYYSQTLIPSGGTINWMQNCKNRGYKGCGYKGSIVCDIPIAFDCHIKVEDYKQPTSSTYGYNKEYEEFFTSVTFFKKEFDDHSIYAPNEYERAYPVYFPYGARFNEDMLKQIGESLNGLINLAREVSPAPTHSEQLLLTKIEDQQKKLIKLLLNGTNNKSAVTEIMQGTVLPKPTKTIKPARYPKDWLPYFNNPASENTKNAEENKDTDNNENSMK